LRIVVTGFSACHTFRTFRISNNFVTHYTQNVSVSFCINKIKWEKEVLALLGQGLNNKEIEGMTFGIRA